ncbi:hypothetical protein D3C87_1963090 [compost metagenome]
MQRILRTGEFLAIVRGNAALVGAQGQAVEIGAVAEEHMRRLDRGECLGRGLLGIAGAGADHNEPAGHGRVLQPGTRTMAK